jgi:hypothetical protein
LRVVSSEERVAVVIRPLDNALAVLRLALIPVAAAAASLPVLQAFTKSFPEASRHWLTLAAAGAVVAVGVTLLQTQPIGSRVDRALARIRRRVAMACNHTAGVAHDEGRVACMLTPQILRAPVFPYDEQSVAVSKLTHACGDRPGGFWFIEGDSGSGKTRAALRFVQSLVRDQELFELGSRCYLYDFSESEDKQAELTSQLGGSRLDDAVVLIDNFQLVRPLVLQALTQYLMGQGSRKSERLVVFLARPGDVWNLDHGSDVQLLSAAKAQKCHVELFGPSAEIVARRVAEFDREAARQIEELERGSIASAAQLHFAQVIVRNRAAPPELLAILRLLADQADAREARRLVDVVALVTALSVHRGGFSRRDLHRALRPVARRMARRQRLPHMLRVWTTFRRLHRVGLVPKMETGRTRYVFHEAIAELCVDRLWEVPGFKASFTAVAEPRLRRHVKAGKWFGAWLVAAELGNQELLLRGFDAALSQGAYLRMLRCLERAGKRYRLLETSKLQLGILLNRTGRFIESRSVFGEADLLDALATSEELAAMLSTSRMEATHDAAAEANLSVLVRNPDPFVAIVGEYWQRHMAMHRGEFDAERMLELANEAFELIAGRDGYWSTYSLARMHFDSLRHHYLMGGEPLAAISTPERRRVGAYLSERLATYEALHMLYTKAHVTGHVLLPRRAIFRDLISLEDAKRAGVRPAERDSIESLVKAAQLLYRQTTDEFWQYGDREAQYLQADILNAEMIEQGVALDAFADRLSDYRDFGAANFKLVRSYPHFYTLRWHMLRYYDVHENARSDSAPDLIAAHRHLERVLHFDTEARNRYGVMRGRLLGVLLRAVTQPLSACKRELNQLHPEMLRCRYGFEAKLIAHLLERDGLHPEELRLIFRFYPFVHQ